MILLRSVIKLFKLGRLRIIRLQIYMRLFKATETTFCTIKKKIASKDELEKLSKEIIEEVKSAVDFALESKFPSREELYTDVYL